MKRLEKEKVIALRKQGYSLNEIKEIIPVSKSTISLWVRDISLSKNARSRIEEKMTNGQIASQKSKRLQTLKKEEQAILNARSSLKGLVYNALNKKLFCALIYYCEGIKNVREGIGFTNSDPGLVKLFIKLFRESFTIDEKRIRVCMHLHAYHQKDVQLRFWSKTITIPTAQFIKPYQKKNSGLYKKEGYQGCVSIRYSDVKIARELKAIALEFMKMGL